MKELIEDPANVRRLWHKARGYVGMSDEQVTVMAETVLQDMTPEDLDRPRPAQQPAPTTLTEAIHKPDLAERERAAFDELNDAERWDGLS